MHGKNISKIELKIIYLKIKIRLHVLKNQLSF